MKIGVVVVVFDSADVILDCIESLLRSKHRIDSIVICDNSSPDRSVDILRDWAKSKEVDWAEYNTDFTKLGELGRVTLLRSKTNLGFAGGVNIGLQALSRDSCDLFWLLNPDSVAMEETAGAIAACAQESPEFGIMGGRILFQSPAGIIQSDGGRINSITGVCTNVNQGHCEESAQFPDSETLDFVSGAHLVVSRRFYDQVGPMNEDYFLYYEEIDWATRRGKFSIVACKEAVVVHQGGTAIGSGAFNRASSAFSYYFNYRNRIRYIWQFNPVATPAALIYSMARLGKIMLYEGIAEAIGAFLGLLQLPAPRNVKVRIAPNSRRLAFGRRPSDR